MCDPGDGEGGWIAAGGLFGGDRFPSKWATAFLEGLRRALAPLLEIDGGVERDDSVLRPAGGAHRSGGVSGDIAC